jgi:hypothetical protein
VTCCPGRQQGRSRGERRGTDQSAKTMEVGREVGESDSGGGGGSTRRRKQGEQQPPTAQVRGVLARGNSESLWAHTPLSAHGRWARERPARSTCPKASRTEMVPIHISPIAVPLLCRGDIMTARQASTICSVFTVSSTQRSARRATCMWSS